MENLSSNLTTYLENLKQREKTKHRTRLEEIIEPHYTDWNWTNDTFFKDMTFLWISLRRYMRNHTEFQLAGLIEWASDKNLHVKQFTASLRK